MNVYLTNMIINVHAILSTDSSAAIIRKNNSGRCLFKGIAR